MAKQYNMYEYGTSPRKLQPEYTPNKKQKATKPKNTKNNQTKKQENKKIQEKNRKKQQRKILFGIGIGFIILFAISYRNSQIDEEFSAIQAMKKDLSTIEKENEQLEVSIENGSNLNNIEQSAKELLGMQKLNNKQSVYISLPKVDYIEDNQN